MKDNKIKFAVVGAGHIGKRHAEMIFRNKESELVAFCDVKPAQDLNIEHYNVSFFYSKKSNMIDTHFNEKLT